MAMLSQSTSTAALQGGRHGKAFTTRKKLKAYEQIKTAQNEPEKPRSRWNSGHCRKILGIDYLPEGVSINNIAHGVKFQFGNVGRQLDGNPDDFPVVNIIVIMRGVFFE